MKNRALNIKEILDVGGYLSLNSKFNGDSNDTLKTI